MNFAHFFVSTSFLIGQQFTVFVYCFVWQAARRSYFVMECHISKFAVVCYVSDGMAWWPEYAFPIQNSLFELRTKTTDRRQKKKAWLRMQLIRNWIQIRRTLRRRDDHFSQSCSQSVSWVVVQPATQLLLARAGCMFGIVTREDRVKHVTETENPQPVKYTMESALNRNKQRLIV